METEAGLVEVVETAEVDLEKAADLEAELEADLEVDLAGVATEEEGRDPRRCRVRALGCGRHR